MKLQKEVYKGSHPGEFLAKILESKNYSKAHLARCVKDKPQTLSSIINGKRRMNVKLSLKIEELFELEEGILMTLQVFYDIKIIKVTNSHRSGSIFYVP